MSFKTKVKLLIICVFALTLSLLCTGCIGEMTAWQFLEGKNAKQGITYYANGGNFGELSTGKDTVDIYYVEGASVISDFSKLSNPDYHLVRAGYTFVGWYKAELKENGEPLYVDENGNPVEDDDKDQDKTENSGEDNDKDKKKVKRLVITSEPADLSPIKKDEHRYVCAQWAKNEFLTVKLVSEGAVTLEKSVTIDGVEYEAGHVLNSGDDIASAIFIPNGEGVSTVSLASITVATCKAHTFLQYYSDEACTLPISRYTRGEKGEAEGENSVIYAKYITGKYTIVKTAKDVTDMFSEMNGGGSYYFFNSDPSVKEIDLSGRSVTLRSGESNFNIKIEGNGFTLKNLNYAPSRTFITNGSSYSMFGRLTADASIRDLTLQNVTMDVQMRTGISVSFFAIAGDVEDGATLENFTVSGLDLTMKVPANTTVENIPKTEDGYDLSNWMFGGQGSDAAFMQKFTGVTVSGNQIKIST